MSVAKKLKGMSADQRHKWLRKFALTRPSTPDMLHDWVFYIGGVYIPRTKVCKDHVSPFDAFANVYFEEGFGTLIKGSRGLAGKTFWDGTLAWTEAITKGAQCKILGGSEEQSRNVQKYLTNTHARSRGTLWEAPYAPRQLISKPPTMTHLQLTNGGEIEALRASQQSVRGPHPQKLIMDEIDEMEQKIFDAALGQPMSHGGLKSHVVCTSTHQNVGGTFDYARKHAREQGWMVCEWCVASDTQVSTPNGLRRIDEMKAGDHVYGYDGAGVAVGKVSWCGATRTSSTLDIILGNGRRLRCTPDHLLMSEEGWKRAEEVSPGSRIVSELREGLDIDSPRCDSSALSELPSTTPEGQPTKMSGMRQGSEESLNVVSSLLEPGDHSAQQDEQPCACGSQGAEDGSANHLKGGSAGARVAERDGSELGNARTLRDFHTGLRAARPQGSGGGDERLLAHQAGGQGEGCQEAEVVRGRGLHVCSSMGKPESPVVEGFAGLVEVVAIEQGPEIQTWDMTVPGLDSFIAEGVVVHNCYKETSAADGFVTDQMIAEKKAQMPAERYYIEVELQEPSFENRIFEDDVIDFLFDKSYGYHTLGQETFSGEIGQELIFVPPVHEEIPPVFPMGYFSRADYSHGVDWGSRQDRTVVHSMKSEPGRDVMAAWGSWKRQSYHKMADHVNERVKRYGGPVVIDGTGLGTVMEELMDVPYEAHEFSAQKATREMYNNFISAVQRGEKIYAYIETLRETFKLLTTEHVYSDKHTPDEFVAAALEHKALESAQAPLMGRA